MFAKSLFSRLLVSLALGMVAATTRAQEIGFVEDFALAADREKALATLVPGTEDYFYFHSLHYLNTEQFDRVNELLKPWIDRFGESARVVEIRNRQALLTYPRDSKSTLDYLRNRLGLSFHHQRELPDAQRDLPSKLDPAIIAYQTLLQRALSEHVNTDGIEDNGLERFSAAELDPVRLRHLLQRLITPDLANLPTLVARELKLPDAQAFGSMTIHRAMTRAQLDELREQIPSLFNDPNYVSIYLTKLRPSDDVDLTYDTAAQIQHLEELWKFAEPLNPVHNSLKASILYRRLDTDLRLGTYDKARFLKYLQLPRSVFYINQKYLERVSQANHYVDLNADFSQVARLPIVGNDEPLIREYLQHFLLDATDTKEFETWVDKGYLRRQFAEVKIVNGLGDKQNWDGWLSPDEYRALVQRVDLDFPPATPHQFTVDQPVELKLFVKNVENLIVKVFELNTDNYYRTRTARLDSDINLDGLVPHHEETFQYKEAPALRVERSFKFDQLKRPGVYVIDFIGNGKSSRALIRKGHLHHLVETTIAGQRFTILDENRLPVKDAKVWMSGREYTPDEVGQITVPFSTQPGIEQVILSRGGLSVPGNFNHENEVYQLSAGLFVDRESLLRGNKAQLVIRPGLRLNGMPVPLKLLKEQRLKIAAVDLDGIVSVMEFPKIELTEAQETIQEFQTPSRLRQITFEISATVDSISQSKPIPLSVQQSFSINEIEATDAIRDVHLVRGSNSYALEVRGKTGEPRARQAVSLSLKHREFRRPADATLQTDDQGRIELGALLEIDSLQATVAGTPTRGWALPVAKQTMVSSIHVPQGQSIEIPLARSNGDVGESQYSLLEIRGDTFVADYSRQISPKTGSLEIKELPAGDFQLRIKSSGDVYRIRVTAGKVVDRFALGRDRFLEMRSVEAPFIQAHKVSDETIQLQLAGDLSSARVHVFAARQIPRFEALPLFGQVRDAEPQWVKPSANESVYVAGRDIGDEYRYILDRKFASRYAGNMLDRPSFLLNPWTIRETADSVQVAAEGGDFGATGSGSEGVASRTAGGGGGSGGLGDPASLDFLKQSAILLANLRPDDNGVVTIDRAKLGAKTMLQIVLVDELTSQSLPVALPEVEPELRDLRLANALDPEKHFAQTKQVSILSADKTMTIEDIGSSKLQTFDDLGDVYRVFAAITSDAKLNEFSFILQWPNKTDAEKSELYSKFACHELNFFLSKKDPKFFADVVRPFLANKRYKTFVDQWLLEQPLEPFFDSWQFERLNVAERIMLSQVSQARRPMLARNIRELYELSPTPRRQFDHLYDLSLKSNSLDAGFVLNSLGAELGEKLGKSLNAPGAPESETAGVSGGMGGGRDARQFVGDLAAVKPAAAMDALSVEKSEVDAAGETADKKVNELNEELAKDGADDAEGRRAGRLLGTKADRDEAKFKSLEREQRQRKQVEQLYRRIEQTSEWVENNYYKLPTEQQTPDLVRVNRFWRDYVEHPAGEKFFSAYFPEAAGSFSQMMFALAVIDLPLVADEHRLDFADNSLKITPTSTIIVLHQQVQPAVLDPRDANLLIGENYFRADDRYRQVGEQRYDKFIIEEFVTHVLYGAQVVITNPTSTPQPIDLLMQIPQGSLPANNAQVTRSIQMDLGPFSTQTVEYYFYFPRSGQFKHYPAHVALDQRSVAVANPLAFNVVDQPSIIDRSSWAYVSQNGTEDEVIEFLKRENVLNIDLSKIAFRVKDAKFFEAALNVLRDRLTYNHVLWSYSVQHNDPVAIREFLTHSEDFARQTGLAIDSQLLKIDPVDRRWYEHREYWPLANARTYRLGPQRKITNGTILAQYHQLLGYLCCKREFSADDQMALVYYLLLQDRIEDAFEFFSRINSESLQTKLQYDYLAAFMAMSAEELDKAEQIAKARQQFPVDRWRKLFQNVLAHVNEARGGTADPADPLNREQLQTALAAKSPNFEFTVESRKVAIRHQNLKQATVNYYTMDLELLFSRNPFVQQGSQGFSLIRPNTSQTVELEADKAQTTFDLPAEFHNSNVLVEIVAGGQTKSAAYYANSLAVQVSENYGQIKVANQDDGKPLSKVYVKVYARKVDGSTGFYKDGYTDTRGRFDFASLSNQSVGDVDRFALLILSDQHGATVREAVAPKE